MIFVILISYEVLFNLVIEVFLPSGPGPAVR